MTLDTANTQEVAYQTKPDWWGTAALGLSFKFKYLVDVVNSSNSQELGQLTAGNIDWSNNYLPGINMLTQAQGGNGGYTLKFYWNAESHYMLSGNTVWLEPNTTKAPMNNVNFRKALADALNPSAIAQSVYGGIASPSTPTGLLPTLNSFVDQSVVSQNATTYDPAKAKQLLAASGYNGRTLTLEAPQGWSDWNSAQTVIAQELNAVGIKVQVTQPSFNQRTANITNGTYDLALDNNAGLDSSPWSYFQRVYQLPIQKQQSAQHNWERINSPADWTLVQQAAATAAVRHRQAEPDLLHAGEGLPAAAAGDPALVQRHLVPGQHPVLVKLPVEHEQQQPEHPGHVERLHRRHDHGSGPGAADAGQAVELTSIGYRSINH